MHLKKGDRYQIFDKQLILEDEELDLYFKQSFDPLLLPESPRWGQEVAPGCFVNGTISGTEFLVEMDGIPHGECCLYYASKVLKARMFYHFGKLHGPSVFFSEEGTILSSSWFIEGLQQGKCYWSYFDGKPYSLQRFKHGLQHGHQEYYYRNGTLKTWLNYENGVLMSSNKNKNRTP